MRRPVLLVAGFGLGVLTILAAAPMGCSSKSGNSLTPPPGSGTSTGSNNNKSDAGSGGGQKDGSSSGTGDATTTTPSGGNDSGTVNNNTMYGRLGGHAGIRAKVDAVAQAELQNGDVASYFIFQAGAPANDHPTADMIEECLTDFIGSQSVVGGPETYPTTVMVDGGTWACRTMTNAHKALNITGGTFDTFVAIMGEVLQEQGVDQSDLSTLIGAIELTKPQIANPATYDAGPEPYDGGAD
jgi:hypothetical protein